MTLLHQYLRIAVPEENLENAIKEGSAYLETMTSLLPQDAIEGALFTQMLSLQALGMKFMRHAANSDNSPQVVDRSVDNFAKLLRLQHETIETLNRYRRRGTHQMVVQHVNVTQGGQAIVGGVQEMGGGFKKNEGKYPMKQCGAKARTNGHRSCQQKSMANGRCRFHGGMSTGPRTYEGKKKAREAVLKHGFYTSEAIKGRRAFREIFREIQRNVSHLPKCSLISIDEIIFSSVEIRIAFDKFFL